MRPICVKCGREMESIKNGQLVYHPMEQPTPGPAQYDAKIGDTTIHVVNMDRILEQSNPGFHVGKIDFVIVGDKYQCPECKYEIVTGFGQRIDAFDRTQEELKRHIANAKDPVEILRAE